MTKRNRFEPARLLVFGFCLGAIGLAFVDVLRGSWDHDSGLFLLLSSYVSSGLVPYIDFRTMYTPLMIVIDSVPFVIGIPPWIIAITLPLAWISANVVVTYLLTWKYTGDSRAALVIAGLYPLFCIENGGNHVTLEHGVVFFTSLALLFSMRESPWASGLAAGAMLGLAFLSKQVALISCISWMLIAVWTFKDSRLRRIGLGILGFVLTMIPLLVLLLLAWRRDGDGETSFDLFQQYVQESTQIHLSVIWNEFQRSPFTAWLVLLCVLLLGLFLARPWHPEDRVYALAFGIPLALYFAPRMLRNYPHYDLNAWPFLAMTLAYALKHYPGVFKKMVPAALAGLLVLGYGWNWQGLVASGHFDRWTRPNLLFTTFRPVAERMSAILLPGEKFFNAGDFSEFELLTGHFPKDLSRTYGFCPDFKSCVDYYDYLGKPTERLALVADVGQAAAGQKRSELLTSGYHMLESFSEDPRIRVELYLRSDTQ